MKLSSHGLWDSSKNISLPAANEEEVFKNLNLDYREPRDEPETVRTAGKKKNLNFISSHPYIKQNLYVHHVPSVFTARLMSFLPSHVPPIQRGYSAPSWPMFPSVWFRHVSKARDVMVMVNGVRCNASQRLQQQATSGRRFRKSTCYGGVPRDKRAESKKTDF
ncbi:hypothetical protein C0Q70_09606 [Pomacea canaliculata]|uniref:DNA polymerase beta thumb domain-containing protein n=1 Tax=Pomacea canaliculata TaxID=400727 RepID=A0A2T7PAA2_POMCA|nr:hypothetical protein C0Q70_09606 [Pomacea canaliculata]